VDAIDLRADVRRAVTSKPQLNARMQHVMHNTVSLLNRKASNSMFKLFPWCNTVCKVFNYVTKPAPWRLRSKETHRHREVWKDSCLRCFCPKNPRQNTIFVPAKDLVRSNLFAVHFFRGKAKHRRATLR
jgi:hypothetical protein